MNFRRENVLRYILLSIVFCYAISFSAQKTIEPISITTDEGLSQGYIPTIIQDQEGFIWIGTKNGLNRYDGERFKVFIADDENPFSLSSDFITDIFEVDDFLIIATGSGRGAINLYHKRSNKFHQLPLPSALTETGKKWNIIEIIQDVNNQFWLYDSTHDRVWSMQIPQHFWSTLETDADMLKNISWKQLPQTSIISMALSEDKKRLTYHDLKNQFWTADIETLQTSSLPSINGKKTVTEDYSIQIKDDLVLFLESKNELNPRGSQTIKTWKNDTWSKFGEGPKDPVQHYFQVVDNDWLVLYQYGKLEPYFFHISETDFTHFQFTDAQFKLPPVQGRILSVLTDRSGNVWIGTNGQGIFKINFRNTKVETYFKGASIYNKPFMFENGLVVVSDEQNTKDYLSHNPYGYNQINDLKDLLSQASTFFIQRDKNNTQWLAWHGYDTDEFANKIYKVTDQLQLEGPIFHPKNLVTSLYFDPPSQLLAYANKNSINFYHPTRQQSQTISLLQAGGEELASYSIAKTQNDHWWLGTQIGLFELVPNENVHPDSLVNFSVVLHQKDNSNINDQANKAMRHNDAASLLTDPNDENILWVGTKGGGLHRLDTREMTFSYLTQKEGLPNNVIYGVLADEEGHLWLSSNLGLIKYTPASGNLRNYTTDDGLQGNEFNTWAYSMASGGRMLFGGTKGLNVIDPNDFQDNRFVPPVRFTSLVVNNSAVEPGDSTGIINENIVYEKSITLPYSKNTVLLEFAALEMSAPEKNRFQYYLEGSETEWVHESIKNEARYLNISPGSYVFKIKAANGDGVWSDEVTSLDITILPPWYRTTIAYLIYLGLFALGLWQFLRFQKRRVQLNYEVQAEQKEKEQLKQLDEAKSRLYTNITHEFRTPLTVISGMANQLEGNTDKKETIKRNSEQLLNLVNQMLDLRKLESGAIIIQKKQGDILKFLRYLTESLKSYAEGIGLSVHFISDEEKIMMDFDAEKMTRIHSNLLSNAIKFTPDGGNIYVQLEVSQNRETFQFSVRDTGVGIPENKLPNIFDRFYQADNSATRKGEGTGIGLTLVSELVKAMDGTIKVKSQIGRGTSFNLDLPITHLAERAKEDDWKSKSYVGMVRSTPAIPSDLTVANEVHSQDERPNVLIVEDNADVIHYLISCLKHTYQIKIAMNGEEGIEKALEEVPDLIISDVMMPIKDGFELCQTLKLDERTSHIPIVLLTAKADVEARLEGLQRGADAYLSKPFLQEELLVILQKQLELRATLQRRFHLSRNPELVETSNSNQLDEYVKIEDEFLKKIRDLVEEDLSDADFGMSQLIRGLGMSRSQIYKKVKAVTGSSPSLYIRTIRLTHAHHLLKTSDLNISEIAYDVGFSSPSYFSTAYSEVFGKAPNETRK